MTPCVLDTDVVIAVLDRSDAHHGDATSLVTDLLASGTGLLLSLINYAETLVRPSRDERTLQTAIRAIDALGIGLVAPTAPIAREAARLRGLNISLADGFALATAKAHGADLVSFDLRVRRALRPAGLELPAAAR